MSNHPHPTEEFKANSSPGKAEATGTYDLEQTTASDIASAPNLPTIAGYRISGEIARGGMRCVLAGVELILKKAMISLRLAVEYGWRDWEYLENDEDFDPLREWPEFQKAIDEWKVQYAKKR